MTIKSIDKKKPVVITVLGPTASGKSALAVKIALWLNSQKARKKFGINGAEIISADSRQVYKRLDIGTGKVPGRWQIANSDSRLATSKKSDTAMQRKKVFIYKSMVHHLIDFANPNKVFTAHDYQRLGKRALKDIISRNKIPVICGGTGFYMDALIYNYALPKVKPNLKLRKKLERMGMEKLYTLLKKKDPRRAQNIDSQNPRRLIRALEIILMTKKPVPILISKESPYEILKIGIKKSPEELHTAIHKRLKARLREGMLNEAKLLYKNGLSFARMRELGLEYRYMAKLLEEKITRREFEDNLEKEIRRYARRQLTWWRRQSDIHWLKSAKEALIIILKIVKNRPGISPRAKLD